MVNNIETMLSGMKLSGMHTQWKAMVETRDHFDLSLIDGLEVLLQAEQQDREQKRFERLIKNARFRYRASIEELRFDASRGMDKTLITTLATGDYIKHGEAVLITGATGCGKSFLASALGHQACMQGHKVLYFNFMKLMQRLKVARIEGTVFKLFDKIAKTDLLILDDFGLAYLDKKQQMDLMEIIEDRHAVKSTLIASQLPLEKWFDVIGDATIADAILDRLIHSAYKINLTGESLRKKL